MDRKLDFWKSSNASVLDFLPPNTVNLDQPPRMAGFLLAEQAAKKLW